MKERVGIYADCSSLWHGCYAFAMKRELKNRHPRVDYAAVKQILQGQYGDQAKFKAFVVVKPYADVLGFANTLHALGYEVQETQPESGRTSWQAISGDLARSWESLDRIVLLTQAVPYYFNVIESLLKKGRKVDVYEFPPHFGPRPPTNVKMHEMGADYLYDERRGKR